LTTSQKCEFIPAVGRRKSNQHIFSGDFLSNFLNILNYPIYIIDKDYQIIFTNAIKIKKDSHALRTENKCYNVIFRYKSPCLYCGFKFNDTKKSFLEFEQSKRQIRIQLRSEETGIYKDVTLNQSAIKSMDKIFFIDIVEKSLDEFAYDANDQLTTLGAHVQTVAHELSNPVTGLNLTQQQIERLIDSQETVNSGELRPFLNLLSRDIRRAAGVISEIRNYSRAVSSSFKIAELKPIFESAIKNVERLYATEKIKVTFCWELPDHFILFGNAAKLEQCLINIIRNSFETFSARKKNSKPEINISVQADTGRNTKIQIIDNAGGISNNVLNNVFKPYFTTKEQFRGLGLGLYIASKILKEHQSTIQMESIEEKTIVTIYMKHQVNLQ